MMDNATLLERVQEFFGRKKSAREQELESELDRLKLEMERLKGEIKTADEIYALIADNVNSGASSVKASEESESRTAVAEVVRLANGRA